MKIKRFVAPDTRQALRLVREELGPDAVVLSSRSSEEGAEVIVAIDYDEQSITAAAEERQSDASPVPARAMPDERALQGPVPQAQAQPEARRLEKQALRGLRNEQDKQDRPPVHAISRPAPPSAASRMERQPSASRPQAPRAQDFGAAQTSTPPQRDQSHARAPEPGLTPDTNPPLEGLGGELRRLRATLEHQLRYLRKQDPDPVREEVLSFLEQIGIGPGLAEGIATRILRAGYAPEDAWGAARELLSEQIVTPQDDIVQRGGVLALIGPTGVGKTVTIAKLAARFALSYGRNHVALITTDTHRIGAQEQLQTFGKLLGIEVDAAASRTELRQLLDRHRAKGLVLVDSAGFGQRDLRLAAQLADLDSVTAVQTYLVISATTQAAGLDEVFSAFGRTSLQGCILTKLDEAVSLGPVIQTLAHYRLPLAYTCSGQRVPEDIRPGHDEDLVIRAEGLAQAGAPRFAPEDSYYSRRFAAHGLA